MIAVPAIGKGTASYHTPGAELVGSVVNHAERVINIDDTLVADRFIAEIDEAMNHYDVRQVYSRDCGMALARTLDQHILQLMVLAARASATVSGGNGGTVITDADSDTNATSLISSIFDAAQAFDEKDVPENDRYIFVKPAQYSLLVESGSNAISTDYNPEGNGSLASGKIFRLAGMEIVKTNNVPTTNIASGPSTYQGNFSTTTCVVAQKSAVGTVKLLDVRTAADWDFRRLGWLITARMAVGSGILRPECAVEIKRS